MANDPLKGKAALLPLVKKHLRISNDALDDEMNGLIESALADMELRGIDPARVCPDDAALSEMMPLGVRAVVYFAKSNFGVAINVAENEQYWVRYDGITNGMSQSMLYKRLGGDENAGDEGTD